MRYLDTFLLIALLSASYSEDMPDMNQENARYFFTFAEKNETVGEGALKVDGLSLESYSELYDLAKNISHAKGIYRETEEKETDELEIRRSVLKKASIELGSDSVKEILEKFAFNEMNFNAIIALDLLERMEILVHEYEVAVYFATMGGINVISPYLYSSNDEIASSVALVLGAAMQSNPTVQKVALENDVGLDLVILLRHTSPQVLSRIIFAVSSFLRNAPEAQKQFIDENGMEHLADILENVHIATKTKLKIINLLNDLGFEQEMAEQSPGDKDLESIIELKRSFVNEIQKYGICKLLPSFLSLADFETHQKVVTAMINLHSVCSEDLESELINDRLNALLKIYDPESGDKNSVYPVIDVDIRKSLHDQLKDLVGKTKKGSSDKATEYVIKEEL